MFVALFLQFLYYVFIVVLAQVSLSIVCLNIYLGKQSFSLHCLSFLHLSAEYVFTLQFDIHFAAPVCDNKCVCVYMYLGIQFSFHVFIIKLILPPLQTQYRSCTTRSSHLFV